MRNGKVRRGLGLALAALVISACGVQRAGLVRLADHKPSASSVLRVLNRLDYLIAGGSGGDERIVLGLR